MNDLKYYDENGNLVVRLAPLPDAAPQKTIIIEGPLRAHRPGARWAGGVRVGERRYAGEKGRGMLACHNCQRETFLIRGLCEDCAPDLHENHKAWMDFIGETSREFQNETGKSPLEDYLAFETFAENKLRRDPL